MAIKIIFRMFLMFLILQIPLNGVGFDKVVIWGHKLHTHTHSYIHNAFYIAFKHLGYETYWFDNADDVSGFDFSHTLFLTEGQVDAAIPLREDCLYVLHNCHAKKYEHLPLQNRIKIQVYTNAILKKNFVCVDKCIYFDAVGRCVYMPWATDLLPFEIEQIKHQIISLTPQSHQIFWVGTVGGGTFGNIEQLTPFIRACGERGIHFVQAGLTALSVQDNIKFIQQSYMAPTIVGRWQKEVGYIPCRIFKNISYGKFGVTNSLEVYELFDRKIVYNPHEYQLFYDACKRMETLTLKELFDLMDVVKTKHTYLNRIETLLQFFEWVNTLDGAQSPVL